MRIRSRAMDRGAAWRILLLVVLAAAVLAGCSKKSKQEPAPGQPAAGAGDTVAPKEIWGQIQQEQAQLEAVIQGAMLGEVHQHADKIRDLVAAAAAATTQGLDANDTAKLQALVTGVGAVAAKLDTAGDSGDSKLVQEHYAALQRQLKLLEVMLKTH